jgi:F-type H+-transporting ATPase subunit a
VDISSMILEHVGDSHHWHILSYTNRHGAEESFSLSLPVILWYEGRPWFYFSGDFDHYDHPLPIGSQYVTLREDKFYITDSSGTISEDENGKILNPKPLDFSITRNVASMIMSVALLLIIFLSAAKAYARQGIKPPRGFRAVLEPIVLFVRDDIVRSQIEKDRADKYVPYLLTLFFFIIINNLIGLIPFFPGSSNVSGNIAFTVTLAVISFFVINISGNREYWREIFVAPGIPSLVKIILVPIEFIGVFTKPFALMIRLFANITAGHIIILSLVSLILILKSLYIAPVSVVLSLLMYLLEFLVAFLQAYIFTLLTALFIGMSTQTNH